MSSFVFSQPFDCNYHTVQNNMDQTHCIGCQGQIGSLAKEIEGAEASQRVPPPPLSAKFNPSFAYKTIKDRLPDIIGKTITFLENNKHDLSRFQHDEQSAGAPREAVAKETQTVIEALKLLREDIENNRPAKPFETLRTNILDPDYSIWNETLEANRGADGHMPRYSETSWLLAECYAYRRIKQIFLETVHLQLFDPFVEQKTAACTSSSSQMVIIAKHLQRFVKSESHPLEKNEFSMFIQLALWSNRCDLSLSSMSAADVPSSELLTNIGESMKLLKDNILCDDMDQLWSRVEKIKSQMGGSSSSAPIYIDLVADNFGYEFFADLCLVHYLTLTLCGKASKDSKVKFRLHLKQMPWFVSDVTVHDFKKLQALMGSMSQSDDCPLKIIVRQWCHYHSLGLWIQYGHKFWTLPHDFSEMPRVAPDLYEQLQGSSLIIFKGDLNYRKLTGDRSWNVLTPFHVALRDFKPAPLVTLRTLKADTVVGIKEASVYHRIKNKLMPDDWLVSGEFGLIQYFDPSK